MVGATGAAEERHEQLRKVDKSPALPRAAPARQKQPAATLTTFSQPSIATCSAPPSSCALLRCGALQADSVDIAYPPLFQSGGQYDLRLSTVSNDSPLHYGVILCSLGAK